MEELKELLLNTIESKKKCYFDIRKLAGELKLNKTSDFVLLNKALNELEDDYLIFRDKNNYFYSVKQSNFYRGIIRINKKGFGFLDLDEDNSIYIPSDAIKGAFDNDEVLVERIGDEGVVRKIIAHNTEYCVGIISGKKNSFHFDDERLKGKSVNIVNRDSFNLVSGLKVQIRILDYKHPIKAEIVKIIGHVSDPGVDISSILVSNGIKMEFDDSTLEHANMIKEEIDEKEYRIRRDLRDRVIVTIDGDDSKDFDDAISIEKIDNGYKLGVHIADVSYYVTYGSALDNEAYQRGTSVYVCDRVVPMLPHVLSNGICSLNPHVERLCISCDMMIDHDGNVTDYELFPSIIKSSARMTYNNVNKILAKDEKVCKEYAYLGNIFEDMLVCANSIRRKREANGCIDFDKEEAKIVVDKNGKPIDILPRDRGLSERIIEDFMICANECVARHMKWLSYPCVYRIHEAPKAKKLREFALFAKVLGYTFKGNISDIHPMDIQRCLNHFKNEKEYNVVSTLMLRSMQKARYDANCVGHFGLASNEYLHFTSPIRRYPDLIVHRMLRKYVFEKDFSDIIEDEKLMEDYALQSSECEQKATIAEREVDDMKKAEYMQQYIGHVFDGIISSVNSFGFFVELDNTVEGLVHISSLDGYYTFMPNMMSLVSENGNKYTIGDSVTIKVVGANKLEGTVDFNVFKPKKKIRKRVWM